MPIDTINRPSWDIYFMQIANTVSGRSTCLRRSVGAVLVKDKRILSTGYNGAPRGCRHCEETGCLREQLGIPSGERHEICRGSHAEMNAISQAAANGIATEGCWIYCTLAPCPFCAKALINAGCKKVIYGEKYIDKLGLELLQEAGVETLFME